jgi:hypothetical protein
MNGKDNTDNPNDCGSLLHVLELGGSIDRRSRNVIVALQQQLAEKEEQIKELQKTCRGLPPTIPYDPIGYARKQDLLLHHNMVPMYSTRIMPENGNDPVELFSRDQIDSFLAQAKNVIWDPIVFAPRDGRPLLLRFGTDGVAQGRYMAGMPKPWQFIDIQDRTWLLNWAEDGPGGPSHYAFMPQ